MAWPNSCNLCRCRYRRAAFIIQIRSRDLQCTTAYRAFPRQCAPCSARRLAQPDHERTRRFQAAHPQAEVRLSRSIRSFTPRTTARAYLILPKHKFRSSYEPLRASNRSRSCLGALSFTRDHVPMQKGIDAASMGSSCLAAPRHAERIRLSLCRGDPKFCTPGSLPEP